MRRKGIIALVLTALLLGGLITLRVVRSSTGREPKEQRDPAAVEVAPVDRGPIELRRTFTGTLEARGRFVVAANVGGRVERLLVDLADPVRQGQVIAELDDAEQNASVAEARAELSVMRAGRADAKSALEIAERQLQRTLELRKSGLVADADVDLAKSRHLAATTALDVARAQLEQRAAAYQRAHVRSGYTKVIANWSGEAETRVVAERHVAEGDTVAPGDPMITVVDLAPLSAVIHVTEREYGKLQVDQAATLASEAFPEEPFPAVIRRIAPVFRQSSRQARVELEVANPEGKLKPGMFVRVELLLERAEDAAIVPLAALSTRAGKSGVFLVDDAGAHVRWLEVEVGLKEGERVQLLGDGVSGRVVTLGHELIDDGAAITIPEQPDEPTAEAP